MKTDYQRLKDEMNEQRIKMKRMKKKAKELKKPILFPFSPKEMATIVSFSIAMTPTPVKPKTPVMTSLYEYKSSANYCNRMKTISGIINK